MLQATYVFILISVNEELVLQRVQAAKAAGEILKPADIIRFANETLGEDDKQLPSNGGNFWRKFKVSVQM